MIGELARRRGAHGDLERPIGAEPRLIHRDEDGEPSAAERLDANIVDRDDEREIRARGGLDDEIDGARALVDDMQLEGVAEGACLMGVRHAREPYDVGLEGFALPYRERK